MEKKQLLPLLPIYSQYEPRGGVGNAKIDFQGAHFRAEFPESGPLIRSYLAEATEFTGGELL
jgi:hypothetical protein